MICTDDYLSPLADARLAKEAEQKHIQEQAAAARRKKIKKLCAIFIPIGTVIIAFIALFPGVIKPFFDNLSAYNNAKTLLENGEYDTAHDRFIELGDFSDSADMAQQAIYQKAENCYNNGYYQDSIKVWGSLGSYSDSKARIDQAYDTWHDSDYQAAMKLKNEGKFTEAEQAFIALGDYSDSSAQATDCVELFKKSKYDSAVQLKSEGKYEDAKALFIELADYSDSKTQADNCTELKKEADYKTATSLVASGKYNEAINIFVTLSGYKDTADQLKEARYLFGKSTVKTNPNNALQQLNNIGSYKDSAKLKRQAYYYMGCEYLSAKKYKEAVSSFKSAKGYKDSKKKLAKAQKAYKKALNQERYSYVKTHYNRNDYTTYDYLKKLKKAKYKDSAKLYSKLYKWHVKVIAVNDTKNSTSSDYYSLSRYDTMYFHIRVSGGPPGGYTTVKARAKWPDGGTTRSSIKYCYDGTDTWFSYYYRNPYYGDTGRLRVTFYDGKGHKIGSGHVDIV